MTGKRTHVVVIGGGYAGRLAANHLRLRADVDITLVNPRPEFVERIRLHQLVAGHRRRRRSDYGTLLGDGIRLVVDSADADRHRRRAPCSWRRAAAAALRLPHLRGRQHRRDAGVRAGRSRIRLSHSRIRAGAAAARRTGRAAPGRAGDRGRRRPDRHRDGRRAGRAGPRGHAGLRRRAGPVAVASRAAGRSPSGCAKLGVAVLEDDAVAEVRADAVVLRRRRGAAQRGDDLDGGLRRAGPGRRSGLRTDALGRLLTDETLTSVDDPRIVAAGDCRRTVGPAAADELPGRGPARRPGRQHRAEPHRRHRARRAEPGVRRASASAWAARRGTVQLAHTRRQPRCTSTSAAGMAAVDQGGGLQGHGVGVCAARPASPARTSGSRAASAPAQPARRRWSRVPPVTASTATSTPSGSPCCGRCCSPSPTRSSARQPNPTTCCRTAICGGPRWTWRRCATPRPISPSWSPGRRSTRCGRSARRREEYVGPWLPEPLLLDEQRRRPPTWCSPSRCRWRCWWCSRRSSPDERAVFVLREVFGFDYDEIASAVGKSVAAVRQVAHRAREHVQARRKRFEPVDPAQTARDHRRSSSPPRPPATWSGLMAMLAPDVVWTADSDGKASAARRPVVGAREGRPARSSA